MIKSPLRLSKVDEHTQTDFFTPTRWVSWLFPLFRIVFIDDSLECSLPPRHAPLSSTLFFYSCPYVCVFLFFWSVFFPACWFPVSVMSFNWMVVQHYVVPFLFCSNCLVTFTIARITLMKVKWIEQVDYSFYHSFFKSIFTFTPSECVRLPLIFSFRISRCIFHTTGSAVCLVTWKKKTKQKWNTTNSESYSTNCTELIQSATFPGYTQSLFSPYEYACVKGERGRSLQHLRGWKRNGAWGKRVLSNDFTLAGESTRREKNRNKKVTYILLRTG